MRIPPRCCSVPKGQRDGGKLTHGKGHRAQCRMSLWQELLDYLNNTFSSSNGSRSHLKLMLVAMKRQTTWLIRVGLKTPCTQLDTTRAKATPLLYSSTCGQKA